MVKPDIMKAWQVFNNKTVENKLEKQPITSSGSRTLPEQSTSVKQFLKNGFYRFAIIFKKKIMFGNVNVNNSFLGLYSMKILHPYV